MNLLEFLGINPKEQEKVEAKVGLELAISGRLEHKVKNLLRERIDGFKVEDIDESSKPYINCEIAVEVNGGTHCNECYEKEEYSYTCWKNYEEEMEYRRRMSNEIYPHTTDIDRFGECEALFWDVCPALETDEKKRHPICSDCPKRDEVFEKMVERKLKDSSRDKNQQSLAMYLSYSDKELDAIQHDIDGAVRGMGLEFYRIEKGVKKLMKECIASDNKECDECPFEDVCY